MKSFLYILAFASSVLIVFLSNAKGVPQAVTKAPGESGLDCGACHSGANFNPTINLQVKDTSGNTVSQYQSGDLYQMVISVTGENNAKSYGFQMVALSDFDNKDQGRWSNLGVNVKTQTMLQRKYILQSNPRPDGIFTTMWQAPPTDLGSVSFYFSGLAVNLNGSNTGDSPVSNKLTLPSNGISSSHDVEAPNVRIYPNPATNKVYFQSENDLQILEIIHGSGQKMKNVFESGNNSLDISGWPAGVYFVRYKGVLPYSSFVQTFVKIQ